METKEMHSDLNTSPDKLKQKEIMDVQELSSYLGIGKSKIYSLIRHKKIPASKIGRQYRFSKTVIDNWLKERIITEKEELQTTLFEKKT